MQNSFGKTIFYLIVISILIGILYILKNALRLEAYPDDHRVIIVDDPKGEVGDKNDLKESVKGADEGDSSAIENHADQPASLHKYENEKGSIMEKTDKESQDDLDQITSGESSDFFEILLANYRQEILANLPPSKNRSDVIIRYYPHKNDGNAVNELKYYGFYIHRRPVEDDFSGYTSNSIYYGDEVPVRDIQLIAYILLRNNFPLKQIIPSKFHDSWKSKSVEIGADPELVNESVMTLEEVIQFEKAY